jgi:phage shock protein A
MALITRVTRLFTADLHAVLDRLEEPDVLVKQAIREMEDELASRETRLRWLDHEHAQLTRQSADMNSALDAIAEQLDVCFASNEDALARPLIKRRLETQHFVGRLAARLQANAQARVEETANVESNRRDLDAMRQKAEVLLDEAGSAGGVSGGYTRLDTTVTDADIEVELLREKQTRALLEDQQAGSQS